LVLGIAAPRTFAGSVPVSPLAVEAANVGVIVAVDRNNLNNAIDDLRRAVSRLSEENYTLAQHAADLDAYLKLCDDKSGCTQPITDR
jgi:hypothetical protein